MDIASPARYHKAHCSLGASFRQKAGVIEVEGRGFGGGSGIKRDPSFELWVLQVFLPNFSYELNFVLAS
jgi:hypothetical protein